MCKIADFLLEVLKKKKYYVKNNESKEPTKFNAHQRNFVLKWPCVWGRYGAHWQFQRQWAQWSLYFHARALIIIISSKTTGSWHFQCQGLLGPWHFRARALMIDIWPVMKWNVL